LPLLAHSAARYFKVATAEDEDAWQIVKDHHLLDKTVAVEGSMIRCVYAYNHGTEQWSSVNVTKSGKDGSTRVVLEANVSRSTDAGTPAAMDGLLEWVYVDVWYVSDFLEPPGFYVKRVK
jgi:hypothetical protein